MKVFYLENAEDEQWLLLHCGVFKNVTKSIYKKKENIIKK